MSLIDKAIAAVTPLATQDQRLDARRRFESIATESSLARMVLDHHVQIENAFAALKNTSDPASRRSAQKALAAILTGHSMAEEAVLYPALALRHQKAHSEEAYVEQSAAKVQTAALEELDPMSQDYLDKLEHLRGAVAQHVYQEEGTWFPKLFKEADAATHARLAARYQEEFGRYTGL
ncbi:MAG: hemerythrin domain-containing protein [Pseudomonadota bacterium]|nr:hemerythrin domain-containing protein [Pseudomonadota bacterium]